MLCFLKDAWGSWWQTEWKRTLAFPFLAPNPHPTTCVLLQVRCPRSALWSRISSDGKFVCGLSESDSDYLDHRVEVFFLCFFGEGCWQTSCYSWNYGGRGNIFFIYPDGYDDGTAMWIHPWDGTWIWRFTKPWQMSYFSVNLSWPVFLGSGRRNQIHPPWFDRSLILYRCMNLICFFLRIACRCVHMRLEIVTSLCIGPLTNRLAVQMGHLLRVLDLKQASSSMRLEKISIFVIVHHPESSNKVVRMPGRVWRIPCSFIWRAFTRFGICRECTMDGFGYEIPTIVCNWY